MTAFEWSGTLNEENHFRIEKGAGFHLPESPLAADQQVKEIGKRFEIRATVVDTRPTGMVATELRGPGQ